MKNEERAIERADASVWTDTLYATLRRIAGSVAGPATIAPTVVVHEAWLKLASDVRPTTSREHQIALVVRTMRHVVIDESRRLGRRKRGGGGWTRVSLEGLAENPSETADLVDLAEALQELERLHERQCRVVELRYFGGLTNGEIASVLDVSERTVRTDWRMASAWLRMRLACDDGGEGADASSSGGCDSAAPGQPCPSSQPDREPPTPQSWRLDRPH